MIIMKNNFIVTIDYDCDEHNVFISSEDSSGACYSCTSIDELKEAIINYIDNYIKEGGE